MPGAAPTTPDINSPINSQEALFFNQKNNHAERYANTATNPDTLRAFA